VNIIRMTLYLIGADIYSVQRTSKNRGARGSWVYEPTVTIVVPAHNESTVIEKTLACLISLEYPAEKLQVVIADDGSTDDTIAVVKRFRKQHKDGHKITIFEQTKGGKADALNNAIAAKATGRLIMCLDADSLIAPDGIRRAVQYFRDPKVVALASNVNIMSNGTLLGYIQRFEYLISYHMKKAQTVFNIEYIIGGIGSMFRHSMLRNIEYYDTNTMTEDIDLTMKILARGNKQHRVVYAADCLTYTEPVHSFKALIDQRFRWKYGRMQTFLKNTEMFFARDRKYTWRLTWIVLPFALLQELLFLLEPFIIAYILFVSVYYHDPSALAMAYVVITVYIWINVWSSNHLSIIERLKLSAGGMFMYALLYVLALVEYTALLQSLRRLRHLPKSLISERTSWVSPERSAITKRTT